MNLVNRIKAWFEASRPNPSSRQKNTQLGVHLEEVSEMCDSLFKITHHKYHGELFHNLYQGKMVNHVLAENLKKGLYEFPFEVMTRKQRVEFLDSLCDQIVTAIGVAQHLGFDIEGALAEVNRANWSKFEDGKPVLDENQKVKKGKDYREPNLDPFV